MRAGVTKETNMTGVRVSDLSRCSGIVPGLAG